MTGFVTTNYLTVTGPHGRTTTMQSGDIITIPAGTITISPTGQEADTMTTTADAPTLTFEQFQALHPESVINVRSAVDATWTKQTDGRWLSTRGYRATDTQFRGFVNQGTVTVTTEGPAPVEEKAEDRQPDTDAEPEWFTYWKQQLAAAIREWADNYVEDDYIEDLDGILTGRGLPARPLVDIEVRFTVRGESTVSDNDRTTMEGVVVHSRTLHWTKDMTVTKQGQRHDCMCDQVGTDEVRDLLAAEGIYPDTFEVEDTNCING